MTQFRPTLLQVCACLLLVAGCSRSETHVTQVLVQLDAERTIQERLTAVEVETYDIDPPSSRDAPRRVDGQRFELQPTTPGGLRLPFSLGVEKHQASQFLLVVTGYAGSQLAIEQKITLSFVEGQTRVAELVLADACFEHLCSTPGDPDWFTSTCHADRNGSCSQVEAAPTAPVVEDSRNPVQESPDGASAMDGGHTAAANMEDARSNAVLGDGATPQTASPDAAAARAMDAGMSAPTDAGMRGVVASDAASSVSDSGGASAVDAMSGPVDASDVTCYRLFMGDGGAGHTVAPASEVHPQFMLNAPWGNKPVQAVKITAMVDKPDVLKMWNLNAGGRLIMNWGPGITSLTAPADVGFWVPNGNASMRLDVHYQNTSTAAVTDRSGVELCVTETLRPHTAGSTTGISALFNLSVPAGATNYEVKNSITAQVSEPITLIFSAPHMRRLGLRMRLDVNGNTVTDAPYSYENHMLYPLQNIVVRNGDKLNVSCFYTNPTNATVTYGENMDNEMCFNFIQYYPYSALTVSTAPNIGEIFGN